MFDRWRQENFFKYLREEYALDALAEYAATPDDATANANPLGGSGHPTPRRMRSWTGCKRNRAGGVDQLGAAAAHDARFKTAHENWAKNSGPLGKRSSDWKSAARPSESESRSKA